MYTTTLSRSFKSRSAPAPPLHPGCLPPTASGLHGPNAVLSTRRQHGATIYSPGLAEMWPVSKEFPSWVLERDSPGKLEWSRLTGIQSEPSFLHFSTDKCVCTVTCFMMSFLDFSVLTVLSHKQSKCWLNSRPLWAALNEQVHAGIRAGGHAHTHTLFGAAVTVLFLCCVMNNVTCWLTAILHLRYHLLEQTKHNRNGFCLNIKYYCSIDPKKHSVGFMAL